MKPMAVRIRRVIVPVGVLTTVLAVGLAGCGHSSNGMARLTVNGQAQVTPAKGSARAGHSGDVLHAGDQVRVTAGEAAVSLMAGGVLQLRNGTLLTVDETPRLAAGAILIQPNDNEVRIAAQRATLVVPSGVASLDVSTAATLTAKSYKATSYLDISGNPAADITAPREVVLAPDTHLPVAATPLKYADGDSWDRQYLASAAAISTQLAAAATGFNAQLTANEGSDASFYQQILPALNGRPDFVAALARIEKQQSIGTAAQAKPGDYLIAEVIALRGTNGSFGDRLDAEMVFFAQGAGWGFVAYDQGVTDMTGVLSAVLAAIGRAALPFTGAPSSQIAIGSLPGPTTATTRPSTRPTTPGPTTTTPVNPRPVHPPTSITVPPLPILQLPVPVLPGPLGNLLNPLLDPLIQALNNILKPHH
jgi:hypothetical protein